MCDWATGDETFQCLSLLCESMLLRLQGVARTEYILTRQKEHRLKTVGCYLQTKVLSPSALHLWPFLKCIFELLELKHHVSRHRERVLILALNEAFIVLKS